MGRTIPGCRTYPIFDYYSFIPKNTSVHNSLFHPNLLFPSRVTLDITSTHQSAGYLPETSRFKHLQLLDHVRVSCWQFLVSMSTEILIWNRRQLPHYHVGIRDNCAVLKQSEVASFNSSRFNLGLFRNALLTRIALSLRRIRDPILRFLRISSEFRKIALRTRIEGLHRMSPSGALKFWSMHPNWDSEFRDTHVLFRNALLTGIAFNLVFGELGILVWDLAQIHPNCLHWMSPIRTYSRSFEAFKRRFRGSRLWVCFETLGWLELH